MTTFLSKIGRFFAGNTTRTETPDYYTVQKTTTGKWAIYDANGISIRDYSRRRDAIRGATRANLNLI